MSDRLFALMLTLLHPLGLLRVLAGIGAVILGYYEGNFFWILLLAVMFVPAGLTQGLAIVRSTGAHPMSLIIGSYIGGIALASGGYGAGFMLRKILE